MALIPIFKTVMDAGNICFTSEYDMGTWNGNQTVDWQFRTLFQGTSLYWRSGEFNPDKFPYVFEVLEHFFLSGYEPKSNFFNYYEIFNWVPTNNQIYGHYREKFLRLLIYAQQFWKHQKRFIHVYM